MKLTKKEILKDKYERWDLTVKDHHNYLVEGVVVHNSNDRIGISYTILEDGTETYEWKAGSHSLKRKRPPEDEMANHIYWYPYTLEPVRKMLEEIHNEDIYPWKEVTLYGEIYGRVRGGHKSLHYGRPNSLNFVAFDLKLDGNYASWDTLKTFCDMFGVEHAPIVGEFKFSLEKAKELSTGHSLLAAKNGMEEPHMREGIVIKPLDERHDPSFGRVVVKFLNDDYVILKNKAYDKGEEADVKDV